MQVAAFGNHEHRGAEQPRDSEEHIDVHGPTPRQVLGQQPAENQADGAAGHGHGGEDAHGTAALAGVAEGREQGRQGGGGE